MTVTFIVSIYLPDADSTRCFFCKISCALQRPLLSSAIVISGLIERRTDSSSGSQISRQNSIYNALCRVNSKVLQTLGVLLLMKEPNEKPKIEESKKREYRASLH